MDVDDLSKIMSMGASVHEVGVFSPSAPHPRFSKYKTSSWTKDSQQKRREELLKRQKEQRSDKFDSKRGIEEEAEPEASMETSTSTKGGQQRAPTKTYADQLMLSEWLVDVPTDFETNWFMVPCPLGHRTLVVARSGETRLYAKNGFSRGSCMTGLPGGSHETRKGETWLDCVLSNDKKVLYVLDVICWKDVSFNSSEKNLRNYWLTSRFEEDFQHSVSSKYRFELLPQFSCDKQSLEDAINMDFSFELDGLLFYCNDAFYNAGLTPLVGWLKPFMLKEILALQNMPVKYEHRSGMDDHVTTAAEFIDEYDKHEAERQAKLLQTKQAAANAK